MAGFAVFLRLVGRVLLGMVTAQGIALLGSLLVARIYIPSQFGLYSTWQATVMMVALAITGRYEAAIVVVPGGACRRQAILSSLTLVGCMGVLLLLLAGLMLPFISLPSSIMGQHVLLAITASVLAASIQIFQSWATAEAQYDELSYFRIAQATGIVVAQVAGGLVSPTAPSLMTGFILGQMIGLAWALRAYRLSDLRAWCRSMRWVRIAAFYRRHYRFPVYSLPADLMNLTAWQIPLFVISSRFGLEAAGLYAMALRILGGPISLLSAAVLDVFKKSAASSYREVGSCRAEYIRTLMILLPIGGAFWIAVQLFSEFFFGFAFGAEWMRAGTVAIWLAPMFALKFAASPLGFVLYIAGCQLVDLLWQVSLLVATSVALTVPTSFESAVRTYALGYAGLYVVYLMLSYHFSRGSAHVSTH